VDRLDKITIVLIAGCILAAVGMLGKEEIATRRKNNAATAAAQGTEAYAQEIALNKQIYQEVTSSMEKGLYTEAAAKLRDVMEKYPGKSLSYVYLARLSVKEGKLGDAIRNYRRAVEMDPDYIDKRTPFFAGSEIKEVVKEGLEKFSREKKLRPQDETVDEALKGVYYLQRRLLGGCE